MDFETETFVVASPLTSNPYNDHDAREDGLIVSSTLRGHTRPGSNDVGTIVTHALRAEGFDASEDGMGRGTPIVPVYAIQERAISANPAAGPDGIGVQADLAYTLEARSSVQSVAFRTSGNDGAYATGDQVDALTTGTDRSSHLLVEPNTLAVRGRGDSHDLEYRQDGIANAVLTPNGGRSGIGVGAIAFDTTQITSATNRCDPQPGDPCHSLAAEAHPPAIAMAHAVRRLTPRECERLQGFPDDYTAIDGDKTPDGPRYRALGNSMAVPVMRWIGERINAQETALGASFA